MSNKWIETTIGQYCPFVYGKSLPQAKRELGKYAVFGSNGIVDYHNDYCAQPFGVIIGRKGSVGEVHLSTKPFWAIDTAFYITNNDIDELRFIYYLLKTFKLKEMNSDSAVPGLNRDNAHSIKIKIPANATDRKLISKKLSVFDEKIALNTQINQTLEQIAQAIFKSWFIDFDPVKAKAEAKTQGATDEQANIAAMSVISGKSADQLNAYKQTNPTDYQQLLDLAQSFPSEFEEIDGVEVPKGWGIEKIGNVIQKIPVGKKYSQKNVFEEGDIPVLDQGKSGIIGYHNDKAGVSASTNNPVIVFANHTCYMRLISYPFSAIQNVFAFKGKDIDVFWLYLATLGKQEFTEYKGHFPDFLIKQIVVPNKEMTFLFNQFISENFMKIFSNDEENKQLSKLRDLLLPKLLSGGDLI